MNITRRMKALLLGCICAATSAFSAVPALAAPISPLGNGTLIAASTSGPGSSGPGSPITDTSSSFSGSVPADPAREVPTLYIVGDTTATAFNDVSYYSPRYGWGTQLGLYIQGIPIQNLAVSGTSSKSYLETEQYQTLLAGMKAGDYLMIGFGHNDERAELGRYTNPGGSPSVVGSFQNYLFDKYIEEARDRGVTPILVTPIVRRDLGNNYTGESGHITSTVTNEEGTFPGGDYAKAIRQLGVGKSVTVLDLTSRTRDVYERLGAQGVKDRHAWTSQREASIDNTHTNLYGAQCNAWFIADELLQSSCGLKNYVVTDPQVPQFSESSINPNYQGQAFSAPTSLSSFWPSVGDWKGTVFGNLDGYEYLNNMYFSLGQEGDGGIRIAVGGDSPLTRSGDIGKISAESDGLAMYYQQIPASQNFIFSADVTINYLDKGNQNSFGLMVRDDIYLDTVIGDTMGDYVAAGPLQMNSSAPWNCFARKSGQLIPGSAATRVYTAGETVHIEIRKGPDGYTCIFGDNPPVSAGFDFPLTAVDSDYVYVGLFAARNADVTFRNVNLIPQ